MNNNLREQYPEYFCGEVVSAEEFLDLQILSKDTYPENVQKKITIRELEDLKNATCISINDGDGLLCVTDEGDIESVLKKNGAKLDGFLNIAFVNAINNGGNKLDCYNCAGATPGKGSTLGDNYCKRGFLPVCRIRFNRMMVDPVMAKTYGEPEVIFFIYCGDTIEEYIKKIQNKEYPGLDGFKYIPYIDEVQNMLGINSDDTDYCFALYFRNIISEKWINGYKDKFDGDFNNFMGYICAAKDEVTEWLGESENNYKDAKCPQISLMHVLSSQYDENGDYLDTDAIHILLDTLKDEGIKEIEKAELPAVEYSFYLNNYYHWNIEEPYGLLNENVIKNNSYKIGEYVFFIDLDDNGENVVLYSHPIDNEEQIKEIYVFKNDNLLNIDFDSMPFLVYKEGLLWFIDKNENKDNKIYSYNPDNSELKTWPVKLMEDVLSVFPIYLGDDCFIYFYTDEDGSAGEFDLTAIKIRRNETEGLLLRIGEIVGINEHYIYSHYGICDYYRTDIDTMVKKSLEVLGLCEFNPGVMYIDAGRDIVYNRVEESNEDPIFEEILNNEEILKSNVENLRYDSFNRDIKYDEEKFKKLMEDLPIKSLDDCNDLIYTYRTFGDEDLIGINREGIPAKLWKVPKEVPPVEEYECSFIGEGFEYYKREDLFE